VRADRSGGVLKAVSMLLGSTVALFIPQAFSTPGGIERDRFCGSISLTTEIGDKFKPEGASGTVRRSASASLTCPEKNRKWNAWPITGKRSTLRALGRNAMLTWSCP
jgi:hypothetical protein